MKRNQKFFLIGLIVFLLFSWNLIAADDTLLLRNPSVSSDHIAFVYAGDIWVVGKSGGEARRLTVNPDVESNPAFSPDGSLIAFSGNYDGNVDVYVIGVEGGSPRRLTFHPGRDQVEGWSPDGKKILFRSSRASYSRFDNLFTIPVEGGFPTRLPMPMAERGCFSPDGKRIAYTPIADAFRTWKRYRGGRTTPIWLFDLNSYEIEVIPHENASDTNPVWLGDRIYFLSDRNHTMNIFAYDTRAKTLRQMTHYKDFDVHSLAGVGDLLVYEQAGRLHLLDLKTGASQPLHIQVNPDLPSIRPHYAKALNYIQNVGISPTGKRAIFEARGDIFTVPAEKGDIRNLTRTPGVCERYPAWSPDGTRIAYFSDASGEYQLMIGEQTGLKKPEVIDLNDRTFFYSPGWSPDSKKLVFTDKRLNLFLLDLKKKRPEKIDTDTYDHPRRTLNPVWSPDSKWIAYTKRLENHFHAIFLYDIENGKRHRLTDGMSDAMYPCFSRDGKYLFFAASTDYALQTGWLDLSSYQRPITRSLYVVVLNSQEPSPFAPESDEEKAAEEEQKQEEVKKEGKGEKEKGKKEVTVVIDLANIDQRILSLPVPARDYHDLQTAADGKLFYLETVPNQRGNTLHVFQMKERKSELFLEHVFNYVVSQDGKKLLYRGSGNTYAIVETKAKPKAGKGKLDLSKMQNYVDPQAEWHQMFQEAWRIERDFFYDPHMHGADWQAVKKKYQPFLAYVGHRDDLNYIFAEMLGELVVGHAYVGGGDRPRNELVPVGLLGADYEIVDGYYRIKKIYTGENWNPDLKAPLTEPGVNVKEGDYILAVNGRVLKAPTNIFQLFENTAGLQTVLQVNSRPNLASARTVTVVPIRNETALRNRDWVEGNRRKVDELSHGRVAYVYLPNTAVAGYNYFNRYYYAQLDHEAAILDERFNGGGYAADYIIDMLNRPILSFWATREGKPFSTPTASIFGPKVMIINEYAGSGGDAMPLYFRRRGLGKLVGKRTWGGLVGIYDYPPLMDNGYITAPRVAIFSPDGKWEVENWGVSPDVEVEMTPRLVIQGHDPQLEEAVKIVLEELEKNPVKKPKRPPYPNRVK